MVQDAAADNETQNTPARAAGIAGSIDVSNQLGVSVNAMARLGQIQAKQFEWFMDDQRRSAEMFMRTLNPLATWVDHMARRSQHVGDGLRAMMEIGQDAAERSSTLRHTAWDPVAGADSVARWSFPDAAARRSVIERLHADHRRLSQVLDRLEPLAGRTDELQPQDWDVLIMGIRYIAEYPDAVHHPLEDRLFVHLLAAPLAADERADVEKNAAGHAQLTEATVKLLADLKAVRAGRAAATQTLAADMSSYLDLQRQHMAFEEHNIFPLAQRRLPAAALQEVGREAAEARDPLFDQRMERFNGLHDYVTGQL